MIKLEIISVLPTFISGYNEYYRYLVLCMNILISRSLGLNYTEVSVPVLKWIMNINHWNGWILSEHHEQSSDRAIGFPMLPGPRWAKIHLTLLSYITGILLQGRYLIIKNNLFILRC